jgi:hypothetical protein
MWWKRPHPALRATLPLRVREANSTTTACTHG